MAVFLPEADFTYLSIPKVACTSLKNMFFEYENGRRFEPLMINGSKRFIHWFYPARPFDSLPPALLARTGRFAVVREPVSRFLSVYSNRVLHYRELSEAKAGAALRSLDLAPDPSLQEFIRKFPEYARAQDEIRHHTRPQVHYLGRDPSFFAGLYPLHRIGAFVAEAERRLGAPLHLRRLQTGGPKISPDELGADDRRRIHELFAEDYEVLGAHF